ncbi:MAG: peptidase M14, partial [Fimbriimonadales bacterium]
ARAERTKGYILTESQDRSRLEALLQLLSQHQIAVYPLTADWQYEQSTFRAGQSYYVPLQQTQYRLLKAAFSTEKSFNDNTFYDVSAWTLPYAYNIDFVAVNREPGRAAAEQPWQAQPRARSQTMQAGGYAYVLGWQDQLSPVMLQAMLEEGLIVRAALGDFTGSTPQGSRSFRAGAMVVAAGLQQHADWFFRLQRLQERFNLPVYTLTTGLTSRGSDLGSHNFTPVRLPQVLVLAGPGVNSTEAGELWYNLERLAGISPSMAEPDRLSRLNLSRYTHILLPDGDYRSWKESEITKLRQWVQQGGVLWGQKRGAAWLVDAKLLQAGVWTVQDMNQLIPQHDLRY